MAGHILHDVSFQEVQVVGPDVVDWLDGAVGVMGGLDGVLFQRMSLVESPSGMMMAALMVMVSLRIKGRV